MKKVYIYSYVSVFYNALVFKPEASFTIVSLCLVPQFGALLYR